MLALHTLGELVRTEHSGERVGASLHAVKFRTHVSQERRCQVSPLLQAPSRPGELDRVVILDVDKLWTGLYCDPALGVGQ